MSTDLLLERLEAIEGRLAKIEANCDVLIDTVRAQNGVIAALSKAVLAQGGEKP